jgi:hypothetical protein
MRPNDADPKPIDPMAKYLARHLVIMCPSLKGPYGGPNWPQKIGYTIRWEIERSTARAIEKSVQSETRDLVVDWEVERSTTRTIKRTIQLEGEHPQ